VARRFLQVALALLGVVALCTGLAQMIAGADAVVGVEVADESAESELRFLSAFWAALGCVSLWLVPRVETQPMAVRAVAAALFAGGIARVISLISVGAPHPLLTVLMAIELIAPPIIIAAQARLPRTG
jgi:hypothetical protein